MGGLNGLAWRGLRARPMRTGLTVAGVTLGVAVLFAGLATNAGIETAVDRAVSTLVGRADLRVAAFGETGLSQRHAGHDRRHPRRGRRRARLRAPDLPRRRSLRPGRSAAAAGDDRRDRPGRRGDAARPHAAATGSALTGAGANDALVNATLAREDGLAVGDIIDLETIDAPVHLRIVGILAGDGPWAGGGGRAVVVPLETAQAAFAADGLTRIDIGDDVAGAR